MPPPLDFPGLAPLPVLAVRAAANTTTNSTAYNTSYVYPKSALQNTGEFLLFVFPAVALLVVALRVYARVQKKKLGVDDALILLALVLAFVESATALKTMRAGFLGVHKSAVPANVDPRPEYRWNYITQIVYAPIMAIVKTALLVYLLRMGGRKHSDRMRKALHHLIILNLVIMLATFVATVFQCTPVSFFWESHGPSPDPNGHCISKPAFYMATAGLTIMTDFMTMGLPFHMFIGTRMNNKLRLITMGVFGLGGLSILFGILRFVWVFDASYSDNTGDNTYDIRICYPTVEVNLAIIAASLPPLKSLVAKRFPMLVTPTTSSFSKSSATRSKASNAGSRIGTLPAAASAPQPHAGDGFALRSLKKSESSDRAPSPTASEEHIMDYDGIMRKTEVSVSYDNKARSIHGRDREHEQARRRSCDGSEGMSMTYAKTMASPGV